MSRRSVSRALWMSCTGAPRSLRIALLALRSVSLWQVCSVLKRAEGRELNMSVYMFKGVDRLSPGCVESGVASAKVHAPARAGRVAAEWHGCSCRTILSMTVQINSNLDDVSWNLTLDSYNHCIPHIWAMSKGQKAPSRRQISC